MQRLIEQLLALSKLAVPDGVRAAPGVRKSASTKLQNSEDVAIAGIATHCCRYFSKATRRSSTKAGCKRPKKRFQGIACGTKGPNAFLNS